ncbi:MAG: DUF4342 domain-containing protein [Synechococcus sp.]
MNKPSERVNDTEGERAEESSTTVESDKEIGSKSVRVEEFAIDGDKLVAKVKELIHEGNIRRIIVKNEEGLVLIEIPLTVGVVGGVIGAALFPVIAALGAIGALVARLRIVIEKHID